MRKLTILLSLSIVVLWQFSCQSQSNDANNEEETDFSQSTTYQNISAKEAKNMIAENQEVIIIDVRTKQELMEGYIENAKHLDISSGNFEAGIQNLDKSKTYILYCRSGSRSARGSEFMSSSGFESVYNIESGILGWQQAGLPTVK